MPKVRMCWQDVAMSFIGILSGDPACKGQVKELWKRRLALIALIMLSFDGKSRPNFRMFKNVLKETLTRQTAWSVTP